MFVTLRSNQAALNTQRALEIQTRSLETTMRRLATGLRVERASDDAAGLSIVTRMSARIRGFNMAIRNVNDGISVVQVADGALEATTEALQRMRELAVQAANGTVSGTDRASLSLEKDQLISEIQRIAAQTTYNHYTLLNGVSNIAYFTTPGGTPGGSRTSLQMSFQVGANAGQNVVVEMTLAHVSALGLGNNGSLTSMLTQGGASTLIGRVDSALESVASIRANLGAAQNRFEGMLSNLMNVSENTEAARSRIRDADVALEAAHLTRASILQQAGTAILAQANVQPQMLLKLLS
ncbi:Flagellin FlaB3 [Candidatus Magnetaquicoccaceae bacterium FCR-1]|uniref:Flagellin n=1 Tax=Candidatus Magnetaquiglobus chichijimensis TaxID=3141448 RepID=A0ABQ0C9Z0_9PROT